MHLVEDARVNFTAYFVHDKTKTAQRRFVADHALIWLRMQHARGVRGAIYYDVDDTLIDGNDAVRNGFDDMRELFNVASDLFVVQVVTARPDDQHARVVELLNKRGFRIAASRVHCLPSALYDGPSKHVEDFKWRKYEDFVKAHGRVVARFGDRLWDVAHRDSLHTYLAHVDDRDCYIFFDPALNGTLSSKLPGT